MNAGVTFERVYRALKEQISGGRFAPGAHLEPAALSKTLNASITPVRDALHRLAGEGLIETPRGEGFRLPQVTEVGLRHLYRWNAGVLDLSAKIRAPDRSPEDGTLDAALAPLELTEHLFFAVAAASANPEHPAAIVHLNDRLRAVRQAELALIDPGRELEELRERIRERTALPLRRALGAYHRRREKLVGDIVARLLAPY